MDYRTSKDAFIKISKVSLLVLFFAVTTKASVFALVSATPSVTVTACVDNGAGSCTTTTSSSGSSSSGSSGGGGGGGGGSSASSNSLTLASGSDSVVFKGIAYPGSIVTLIKNGSIAAEVPASPDGTFEIRLRNLSGGTYSFGIRAEDSQRLRSTLDVYTVYIGNGVTTIVDGLFVPPTISTDKIEVKYGDPVILFGKSAPGASLTISIHSPVEIVKRTKSNSSGAWLYKLDSSELGMGDHTSKTRASTDTDLSLYSDEVSFKVGTTNKDRPAAASVVTNKCDLNSDSRVNILDFSIMAFWYKRLGFPAKVDLNSDKRIDIQDLSILAYCWTG